jgi:hypothetical protein
MAYKNFTLDSLRASFGITNRLASLIDDPAPLQPSAWLLESLERANDMSLRSEKALSEMLIAPILTEIQHHNRSSIALYSGENLNADKKAGLVGECDFIFAKNKHAYTVEAPLFCLLEAKRQDMESGINQCAAQMLGAQIFNRERGEITPFVFGCVTTARTWQFLRLQDTELVIDTNTHTLTGAKFVGIERVLGALQMVIDKYQQNFIVEYA